jgi:uncharacterized protein (TIGR03437 family)
MPQHYRASLCFFIFLLLLSSGYRPRLNAQSKGELLALASGDFDEDGAPDLVLARRTEKGSLVTLRRGNPGFLFHHLSPGQPQSPFFPEQTIAELNSAPDYLGAGDFDADGHTDIIAAQSGALELDWARGNGRGGLLAPATVQLSGALTAFCVGEINRADGLPDLALGLANGTGGRLQIWEGAEGALRCEPENYFFDAPIRTIAAGRLGDDRFHSLVLGAGSRLVRLSGRDRKTATDLPAPSGSFAEQQFSAAIQSVAIGDFAGAGSKGVALLLADGSLQILNANWSNGAEPFAPATSSKPRQRLPSFTTGATGAAGQSISAARLITARVSSAPLEQCLVTGVSGQPLWIWNNNLADREGVLAIPHAEATDELYAAGEIHDVRAALPLRLNEDALSDLVVLRVGATEPEFIFTAPTNTFIVTSKAASGNGSLAKAIQDAAASPGLDRIEFNLPGPTPVTLEGVGGLVEIKEAIVIDGTTQPGYQGRPLIGVERCRSPEAVLELLGGNSVIRGLALSNCRFDNTSAPQDRGAAVKLNGGSNNIIEANYLGLRVDGSCGVSQSGACSSSCNYDVLLTNSSNNLIGGRLPVSRNVITGSLAAAVLVKGAGNNRIEGNLIGVTPDDAVRFYSPRYIFIESPNNVIGGTEPGAGNTHANVYLRETSGCSIQGNLDLKLSVDNSSGNLIGGTTPGARNLSISLFIYAGSRDNLTQGNYIGVDADGLRPALDANNSTGSFTIDGDSNLIGGVIPGARNLIISQTSIRGSNNKMQGNYLGVNATGTAALIYPTLYYGSVSGFGLVSVFGNDNLIGGTTAGAGNLISGLGSSGVILNGKGNRALGNLVGTKADGVSPLGNQGFGIIAGGESYIGGVAPGEGNVIAFNFYGGARGGVIRGNSIHSNQGLGIDYAEDDVSPNIPDENHSGVDFHQNAPLVTLAVATAEGTRIQGRLNSYANSSFLIDVYANATCNYSGYGEGQTYLGSTTVNTDANFNAKFSFTLPRAVPPGQVITATATRIGGVTSEFSPCVTVTTGCASAYPFQYTVTGPISAEGSSLVGDYYLISAEGGAGKISVDTFGVCPWTAASGANWLLLTSSGGSGPGELGFSATRNPGAASRLAKVTVGNHIVNFLQAGRAAVVSAASYRSDDITNRGILSAFGINLAPSTQVANGLPLPDSLDDTLVMMTNDLGHQFRTPLFFISPGQINFLIPRPERGFGNDTTVTIFNRRGSVSQARIFVDTPYSTPGALFSANSTGNGVAAAVAIRVKADGTQTYEPIARFDQSQNKFTPLPLDLGQEGEQIYLALFGTGIPNSPEATVGGVTAPITYVGPQGGLLGLDQVNLQLPRSLSGKGLVDVRLMNGGRFSNTVQIQIR